MIIDNNYKMKVSKAYRSLDPRLNLTPGTYSNPNPNKTNSKAIIVTVHNTQPGTFNFADMYPATSRETMADNIDRTPI